MSALWDFKSFGEALIVNSEPTGLTPGNMYEADALVVGHYGAVGCAYFALIFLDALGNELMRRIRWVGHTGPDGEHYLIRAVAPPGSATAIRAYRVNTELDLPTSPRSFRLSLQPMPETRFTRVDAPGGGVVDEVYDSPVPAFCAGFGLAEPKTVEPVEHFWDFAGKVDTIEICGEGSGIRAAIPRESGPDDIQRDIAYFAKLMINNLRLNQDDISQYVAFHAERFLQTYRMLPQPAPGDRLLDIAAFYPFTFALFKNAAFDQIRCTTFKPAGVSAPDQVYEVHDARFGKTIRARAELVELDADEFPYPAGYFATVMCLETLEHLSRDPMSMMAQINRVMRIGGIQVLTTPNVLSVYSFVEMLAARHPGGANKYSRSLLPAERHNREYTPEEVRVLCQRAGFEVISLETPNIWIPDAPHLLEILEKMGYPTEMRGSSITAIARKVHEGVLERFPGELYS